MRTTDAVLDSVLEKLKDDGHQSDERYTEAFVRSRVNRGDGPVKIRHALAQNGILPDTIDRYLDQGENFWCALLTEVRDRKFGGRAPSDYSEWARQARFLQSRGFTSEQIRNSVAIQESE